MCAIKLSRRVTACIRPCGTGRTAATVRSRRRHWPPHGDGEEPTPSLATPLILYRSLNLFLSSTWRYCIISWFWVTLIPGCGWMAWSKYWFAQVFKFSCYDSIWKYCSWCGFKVFGPGPKMIHLPIAVRAQLDFLLIVADWNTTSTKTCPLGVRAQAVACKKMHKKRQPHSCNQMSGKPTNLWKERQFWTSEKPLQLAEDFFPRFEFSQFK